MFQILPRGERKSIEGSLGSVFPRASVVLASKSSNEILKSVKPRACDRTCAARRLGPRGRSRPVRASTGGRGTASRLPGTSNQPTTTTNNNQRRPRQQLLQHVQTSRAYSGRAPLLVLFVFPATRCRIDDGWQLAAQDSQ